jgi:hypothetical protein
MMKCNEPFITKPTAPLPSSCLNELVASKRATQLRVGDKKFLDYRRAFADAAVLYENADCRSCRSSPPEVPPRSKLGTRSNAIREFLRGRMEVCGPMTVTQPAKSSRSVRDQRSKTACLGLEGEGFVSPRESFIRTAAGTGMVCDRRLLARIHRLTIDRLRAEIQAGLSARISIVSFSPGNALIESIASKVEGLQSFSNTRRL